MRGGQVNLRNGLRCDDAAAGGRAAGGEEPRTHADAQTAAPATSAAGYAEALLCTQVSTKP